MQTPDDDNRRKLFLTNHIADRDLDDYAGEYLRISKRQRNTLMKQLKLMHGKESSPLRHVCLFNQENASERNPRTKFRAHEWNLGHDAIAQIS